MILNTDMNGRLLTALRIVMWTLAAAIMLTPVIGMRVSDGWRWTGSDFVFAAVVLGAACGSVELALRTSRNLAYLAATAIAVGTGFLQVWVNAAVQIVGDGENPLTMLYAGVVAVAVIGGAIARLRPEGMARAMLVAAAAQLLVGAVTFAAEPRTVLAATAIFGCAWLTAAWLFRQAAAAKP